MPDDLPTIPENWTATLPEDVRSHAAMTGVKTVEQLARAAIKGADFKAGLPDDLKGNPTVAALSSVEDGLRMMVNAQKLVGANKIAVPGEKATEQEWAAVHDALGRPKTAKDYKIAKPTLPEGLAYDDKLEAGFRDQAHRLGLNQRQLDGLYAWFMGANVEAHNAVGHSQAEQFKAADSALRTEWGNAYDDKLAKAKDAVRLIADDGFKGFLEESGLGNDPRMVKFMAGLGEKIAPDSFAAGGTRAGKRSPEEAKALIAAKQTDRAYLEAAHNAMHPAHAQAVAEMRKLHEDAYPEQAGAAAQAVRA